MDIANIVPAERVIEIVHPVSQKEMGIRVSIRSINDPAMEKIKRKIRDEVARLESRGKYLKSEEVENNRINLAFAAMTGWEWYGKDVNFNGEKPDFNIKNVRDVFTKLAWFQEQVEQEISDETAFFTN